MVGVVRSQLFKWLKLWIRREFPTVRSVSVAELETLLHQSEPPILLDVRTAPEFAVSHLPTAHRIDPTMPDWEVLTTIPKDALLVVYCSIGYRSARIADQLQQQGFLNVFNLEGSIFQWANEARSLVQAGHPTQKVHPYNQQWGKLLDPRYRASLSPAPDCQSNVSLRCPSAPDCQSGSNGTKSTKRG